MYAHTDTFNLFVLYKIRPNIWGATKSNKNVGGLSIKL